MSKIIVIISYGRSGTNYLCSSFKNFEGFIALEEIFGDEPWGLSHYPALYGYIKQAFHHGQNDTDANLADKLRENPIETINQLHKFTNKSNKLATVIKIIPWQLSEDNMREILAHENTLPIFVTRRHIDREISRQKAHINQAWVNQNTDNLTLELDINQMMSTISVFDKGLTRCLTDARKYHNNIPILSFESDIQVNSYAIYQKLFWTLRRLGFPIKPKRKINFKEKFKAQTTITDPFEKISNPGALRNALSDPAQKARIFSKPLRG